MTTIEVDENEYGSWTVFRVRGEMDLVTSPGYGAGSTTPWRAGATTW